MSPLVDALRHVLSRTNGHEGPDGGAVARVLSNRTDFELLWGTRGDESPGILESIACTGRPFPNAVDSTTLVLVSDGIPDHVNPTDNGSGIDNYVTPYDWVVSYCHAVIQAIKNDLDPLPTRIFILDPDRMSASATFGGRVLPMFLSRLPGISVCRPGDEVDIDCPQDLLDRLQPSNDLPPPDWPNSHDLNSSTFKQTVDLLRDLWVSELTRSGSLHAVSNSVAPIVLAPDLFNSTANNGQVSPTRIALASQLRRLGLLPATTGRSKNSRKNRPLVQDENVFPTGKHDYFDRFQQVRFLLVDDQFELGYERIIHRLLAGNDGDDRVSFEATDSPRCLLEAIGRSVHSPRAIPSERLSEDVFLQELLYLYHLSGACRIPGRSSLRESAKAATDFLDRSDSKCSRCGHPVPFQGIGEDKWEKEDGIDWEKPRQLLINPSTDQSDDHRSIDILFLDLRLFGASETAADSDRAVERHLFLSLILSQVDPSFPIVLFSSTQQRNLLMPLKERPNIITEFAKPVVSAAAKSTDGIRQLRTATTRALQLHKLRCVWIALNRLINTVEVPKKITEKRLSADLARQLRHWKSNKSSEFDHDVSTEDHSFTIEEEGVKRIADEYQRLLCSGFYADAIAVPGNILESMEMTLRDLHHNEARAWIDQLVKKTQRTDKEGQALKNLVTLMACNAAYVTLHALRNLRAHYRCRPFRDDRDLEDRAIWSWRWFLAVLETRISGAPVFSPTEDFESNLNRISSIPTAVFRDADVGLAGCDRMIRRTRNQLLTVNDDLHHLLQLPKSLPKKGIIKEIRNDKRFGFIEDDANDLFFHQSCLEGVAFDELKVGQLVHYDLEDGPKGPRASFVQLPVQGGKSRPNQSPSASTLKGGTGSASLFGDPNSFR